MTPSREAATALVISFVRESISVLNSSLVATSTPRALSKVAAIAWAASCVRVSISFLSSSLAPTSTLRALSMVWAKAILPSSSFD